LVSYYKAILGDFMSKAKRYNPETNIKKSLEFGRANILYIFLIPITFAIIISLIRLRIFYFILNLVGFALFYMTAKSHSIGIRQEIEYYKKRLAKAPKIPYKLISGLLLGLSTIYISTIAGGRGIVIGLFLGIISSIGYFLYFGFDPKRNKLDNLGDISADYVLETLEISKDKLMAIEEDIKKIKNIRLSRQLRVAVDRAYEILNSIEDEPKDLRVVRKFIIVYLDSIKNITKSYVDLDESEITEETKDRLYNLLLDVEERFKQELEKLKRDNLFELDVNIDTLKEQIKN